MKNKALTFLLVLALIFSMSTLSVSATEKTQDGVLARQDTDMSEYASDDNITTTLTVTNRNETDINDVKLTNVVPKGYHLAKGETGQITFATIETGKSVTLETTFEPDKGPVTPVTGDENHGMLLYLSVCLACALAIVLILRSKKARKSMLMILVFCLVVGTSTMAFGGDVFAATSQPISMDLTTTVTVDGVKLPVNSTVSFKKGVSPVPIDEYTVTFDMQGHGTQIDALNNVASGSKIAEPTEPTEEGYSFDGWFKTKDATTDELSDEWNFDVDVVTSDITLYAKWSTSCLAAGTLVTMADGTETAIEDLEVGDEIRTFDHKNGEPSTSHICFIWESKDVSGVFTLHFENGIDVKVVEEHGFFDMEENQYVFINAKNANEYVGHHFYNVDEGRWLKLESFERNEGRVDAYSIISSGDLNHASNGMLSMCNGSIARLANVFDFDDSLNLKYDEAEMARDIELYGLTTREDLAEYKGFFGTDFEDYNMQYFAVLVGKGYLTWDYIKMISDAFAE